MLMYHISQSNEYAIRIQPTASAEFTMSMQDMYLLTNSTMSITGITLNAYEGLLQFTGSISGSYVGAEYRLALYNSGATDALWHGSLQAYQSASTDKSIYENQIPPVISHASENKYTILK